MAKGTHEFESSVLETSSSIRNYSSAVPSSPRDHSSERQLAVEDFLRWSVGAPQHRHRYKGRRVVKFSDDSDDRFVMESDNELDNAARVRKRRRPLPQLPASDDEYQPSEEERKNYISSRSKRSGKARPKSLADRMLRAAVLSHVDLDGKELHVGGGNRKPLKFAMKSSITPPTNYLNTDKIRLVDPRKVTFHSPAFRKPATAVDRKQGPRTQGFTRWAHPFHLSVSPTSSGRNTKTERRIVTASRAGPRSAPLTLVSAEAQDNHSHKQRSQYQCVFQVFSYIQSVYLLQNLESRKPGEMTVV